MHTASQVGADRSQLRCSATQVRAGAIHIRSHHHTRGTNKLGSSICHAAVWRQRAADSAVSSSHEAQ